MAFDPAAATQEYMATLSEAELELARSYTIGNHWLILVGLIVSALVTWLVIRSGVLDKVFARINDNWPNLRVFLVAAVFSVVSWLLSVPYAIYADWWRETQYDRTSQPLVDFLSQGAIGLVLSAVFGSLLLVGGVFPHSQDRQTVVGMVWRVGRSLHRLHPVAVPRAG